MRKLLCLLASMSFAWGHLALADEFKKVKCDSDIPKAMIGQAISSEPVVVAEKKYRALGLKDLGADEISDSLSAIDWQICGADFLVLADRSRVRDVLAFPPHSKRSPVFLSICQVNGRNLPDIFFGKLDGAAATEFLPVQLAWKIDQQRARFVKASIDGLVCPRSGIYAVDRGP